MSSLVPNGRRDSQMTEAQKELFRTMIVESYPDLINPTQRYQRSQPTDASSDSKIILSAGMMVAVVIVAIGIAIAVACGRPILVRMGEFVFLDTTNQKPNKAALGNVASTSVQAEKDPETSAKNLCLVKIEADTNLRSDTNSDGNDNIVQTLSMSETASILESKKIGDNDWYKVATLNRQSTWVRGDRITFNGGQYQSICIPHKMAG